ncbi:MAG: hypothetical protein R3E31_20735 [Chloroflexota bacterium]
MIDGLQDDFDEEILIYRHEIKTFAKYGKIKNDSTIDTNSRGQIINQLGWYEANKSAKQIIAEHLIEIQVIDFENSMLQKKNEYMDNQLQSHNTHEDS